MATRIKTPSRAEQERQQSARDGLAHELKRYAMCASIEDYHYRASKGIANGFDKPRPWLEYQAHNGAGKEVRYLAEIYDHVTHEELARFMREALTLRYWDTPMRMRAFYRR